MRGDGNELCICGHWRVKHDEDGCHVCGNDYFGHEFAGWADHWKWLVQDSEDKSRLYDEITFGRISKPNTAIEAVIGQVDERIGKEIADAIAECVDGMTCDDEQCEIRETALAYPGVKEALERIANYRQPAQGGGG